MNAKQRSGFVIHLLVMVILTFSQTSSSRALTIGMPGAGWDWIMRYDVGMCEARYHSMRVMMWNAVQRSNDEGIAVQDGEAICVVGHGGDDGSIGNVEARIVAETILRKIRHVKGTRNTILLLSCHSASAIQAFVDAAAAAQRSWHGEAMIAGSRGVCITDKRHGAPPLYAIVLKTEADSVACSDAVLEDLQKAFEESVRPEIARCNAPQNDTTIGRCLYDSVPIQNNFYEQFLGYIRANKCNQDNGVEVEEL